MEKISFNEGWAYKPLEKEIPWKTIGIPHDAMLSEERKAGNPGGINTGWFAGRDYIYEKTFFVPEEYSRKEVVLEFEGVYRKAEVYVNGKKTAFRPYGYTNFYVPLTSLLQYGKDNVIQVIARNADQPNSRWYSGAGIYRPVWLYLAEEAHIPVNGVKIRTTSIAPPAIQVSVKTTGAGNVTVEIPEQGISVEKETKGKTVLEVTLPEGRLWSTEHPNLYTCRVTYGKDTVEETFGIRMLSWNSKQGFCINGKREILRGACIHHDNGLLGACAFPEAEERKVRILKENGYNAIRSAHNPCSKALLEACDRLGMMVMDEYVDVWYIHKTEYDYVEYFKEWWQQDLKDMVEKDYNHPCVIMYSTGNEVSETAQKKGIYITDTMTSYLHKLDSTRPVTCGINIFFNFLSSIGLGVYSDKKAEKEVKNSQNLKKKKAVGSEFFNNLAGMLGSDTMKVGATFAGCDIKTKDAFAAMDIAGYNYGILRYRHDLKKYPERLILGSETFCKDAYQFWEIAKKHPRIVGDFVWAGMDYIGEVGIGSWEYEDYAPRDRYQLGWLTAGSGRIDITGKPLGEAGYTKTAFELIKEPVIAVRPVNHTKDKHSPSAWKMTNAMESWSFRGLEGEPAAVEVFARAARVDLYINHVKTGSKWLKNSCAACFSVIYQSGMIEAVAYDARNREIARSSLMTAGEETKLRAVPERSGKIEESCHNKNIGDYKPLQYVRLQYTDEQGIVKPLERGKLKVTVEHGELVGLGSGCPFHPASYLTDTTDTYYGEALAIVRQTGNQPAVLHITDGRLETNCVLY